MLTPSVFESIVLQYVGVLQPNSADKTFFFFQNFLFFFWDLCFFKILSNIVLEFYQEYIRE
jgi:hypothetical protein